MARPQAPMAALAFSLRDVRLLDGPFKHAMELDQQYLLSLDPDRLLHNFRINAGLPSRPTAGRLGRAEMRGARAFRRPLPLGLRADVRQHGRRAAQGEGRCRRGRAWPSARRSIGSGYLSAYPESSSTASRPASRSGRPTTRCTRSIAGLLDMYVHCGNRQALEVCQKFGRLGDSPQRPAQRRADAAMLGNEHGGMNEALANLVRADRRGEVPEARPAVQPHGRASARSPSARTNSPACTPTRRFPSSSAPPGSTN